jgi:hypothetical protein
MGLVVVFFVIDDKQVSLFAKGNWFGIEKLLLVTRSQECRQKSIHNKT